MVFPIMFLSAILQRFSFLFKNLYVPVPLFILFCLLVYLLCIPHVKHLIQIRSIFLLNYFISSFLVLLSLFIFSYLFSLSSIHKNLYLTVFLSFMIVGIYLIGRKIYLQLK